MTGDGGGLSNLGTALVVIFVITVVALFAQFFYALWRRRVFRRRATTVDGGAGDEISRYSSSESTTSAVASKELLYFFCVRPQFGLDRSSLTPNSGSNDLISDPKSELEVIDVDLLKIPGMFGPQRFLFTVSEEEREGTQSPARIAPVKEELKNSIDDEKNGGGVSLEEYLQAAVAVEIGDDATPFSTPFSTPCASPVYFTPTASPVHDVVNGRSTGESFVVTV